MRFRTGSPTHPLADSPTPQLQTPGFWLVLAAFALILVALAAGLRPDAFFVGDPGVKLIVARHAALSPGRPLDIPLPAIGTEATPYADPFFTVHDGHAHAITSELFPLVSAPLLAAFGLPGLYVWPAVGFLGALAACAWLGREVGARARPALVIAVAALGTPLLFYGLEFWEHAPAVAAGTAGAALLIQSGRRRATRRPAPLFELLAGGLFGVSILLRPETAWFALAVVLGSRIAGLVMSWSSAAIALAGTVLTLAPVALYSIAHFDTVVPAHLSTNAALVSQDWWSTRNALAADWLVPSWWSASGPVRTSGLWSVSPAAVVALTSLPRLADDRAARFLWVVALLNVAAVLASAPNSGGGQWGPRYLLFAYVPLAILASATIQQLLDAAGRQQSTPGGTGRPVYRAPAIIALAALLAAGVWVQRASYRQLRGAKNTYGRVVDFVNANTTAGAQIVSDVWWFDQVAAAGLGGRQFFYAPDTATGTDILRRLGEDGAPDVVVVRSAETSPALESWTGDTCYDEERREPIGVRQLIAIRLRYRCGGAR